MRERAAPGSAREVGRVGFDLRALAWRDAPELPPVALSARSGDGSLPTASAAATDPAVAGSLPRALLSGHWLRVVPAGTFFANGAVQLRALDTAGPDWTVTIGLLHCEDHDGEPAPATLALFVAIDPGTQPLRTLQLRFDARLRGFDGGWRLVDPPPPLTVEFTP